MHYCKHYSRRPGVTDMLGCLNWETLKSRRTRLQLKSFHKIFTCQVALKLSDYFQINLCMNLRNSLSEKLIPEFARFDVVKNSLFYWVIPKWNSQPEHIGSQSNKFRYLFDLRKMHFSQN